METHEFTGRADLHMHTTASDGTASARQMLDWAARHSNLNVVAITDHDCIDASLWAWSQQGRYPFDIVPGMEVSSADGHVLALWVTQMIPRGMSLEETVAAIHEQGGAAILAHPFEPTIAPHTLWRYFRYPEVLITIGIDAVETYNAGAITPGNNWIAKRVFNSLNIAVVGNSDAHTRECIARGFTRFPGHTAADFRSALAQRLTVAEGTPWPFTAYLKLSIVSIQRKRSGSLETNMPSTHPTHP